jgi:ubiquitin-like 1-activating enzyme E1 B
MTGTRTTHVNAILGPELSARLPDLRVLLVGAGGIGCELCQSYLSASAYDF